MICKILLFCVFGIVAVNCMESRKVINIGILLDNDDQFEVSIIAISSAVRKINLYSRTQYLLSPHIFRTEKTDILKTGQIVCKLIEKGIAAIFGPESTEINDIIQSVSSNLEIPQFQTFWNPKLSSFSATRQQSDRPIQVFNLHPSPRTLSKALATLVRENDWKSYTVIYENDDGLLRLQETLKQRNPADPAVAFRKLGPKENHRSVLKEIKSSGVLHFILDCEADHILDILREAKEFKLLSEFHSYILTNLDAHTLDWSAFKNIRTNITALRLLDPDSSGLKTEAQVWNQIMSYDIFETVPDPVIQKELLNFRSRKPFSFILPNKIRTKTALLYDAMNLFITVFSNLEAKEELPLDPLSCEKYETSSHGLRFSKALKEEKLKNGLLLEPLTGITNQFDSIGYRQNYLLQIIEFDTNKFRVTGTWKSAFPNQIELKLTSEDRNTELRKKLQQRTFRVVSRLGDPYLMRRASPGGRPLYGNDRFEGYAVDLMHEICKPHNLNCSYKFELVADGLYGNYNPQTKQWNGLIKELLEYVSKI